MTICPKFLIDHKISKREMQIINEICLRPRSGRELAAHFFITIQTIKFHLTRIYKKLDVHGQAGIIAKCWEHKIAD